MALTEDFLVHAGTGALLAICKVVATSRTAPTNMQRQFHHTSRCGPEILNERSSQHFIDGSENSDLRVTWHFDQGLVVLSM